MSPPEFTSAPPREPATVPAQTPAGHASGQDPLRYCVFTTVALIAWIIGAPAAVLLTSALGIAAYWRARRDGLLRSKCVLGDTRLVLLYLGALFVVAAGVLMRRAAAGG